MPEETTPADAQAANDGSTPAQAATQPSPDAQAADGQETITLEEARRLRSESKALRSRLNKFEADEKQRAEAQLSEQQKLEKRAADAEAALADKERAYQARLLHAEIRSQAATMGFKYPDKAARLIDTADIAADDDAMESKVKDALTALLKEMPELGPQTGAQSKQASTSGGATNPSRSQSSAPPALTDEVIAKMTPDEYAARRSEIIAYRNAHPFRYGRPSR